MKQAKHGGNADDLARTYGLNKAELNDFSANINPLGISPAAKSAITTSFDEILNYPDLTYHDLKKSIAGYEQIDAENVMLGNGGAEVIFNLARALKPRKALLFAPTFSEYEEALKTQNADITYYQLQAANNFNYDIGVLDAITDDIDVMFLCSPNNPSGNIVELEVLEKILEQTLEAQVFLIIDESFMDFVENCDMISAKRYIEKYENLIIIKSATKFFAIPGLRIGYAYTKSLEIIEAYSKEVVPWCINSFANVAFMATATDRNYLEQSRKFISEQKIKLYNELCKIAGLYPIRPTANFILFRIDKAIDLQSEMMKHNVLIRSCSNYISLGDNYYRVAVRTDNENAILIDALNSCLK